MKIKPPPAVICLSIVSLLLWVSAGILTCSRLDEDGSSGFTEVEILSLSAIALAVVLLCVHSTNSRWLLIFPILAEGDPSLISVVAFTSHGIPLSVFYSSVCSSAVILGIPAFLFTFTPSACVWFESKKLGDEEQSQP
jgi:hypothetical protein